MSTTPRLTTAKIYQFPRKAIATLGEPNRPARPVVDHRGRVVPSVDFGSGWYHEAAIQSEDIRKN